MIRNALTLLFVFLVAWWFDVPRAVAHDPSAWGGTFRSRDGGATWLPIDGGLFIGGALGLAIDPADPNHLLYATDTRLLRSHNGGRDWLAEQPSVFFGPTLAVAFDAQGSKALAATSAGLYFNDGTREWKALSAPAAASPVRAITSGQAGHYFVAGAHALYRTLDSGGSWVRIGEAMPEMPAGALIVRGDAPEAVYAVIQGSLWSSVDAGTSWIQRNAGLPAGRVDTVAFDPGAKQRLWAAADRALYRSDDQGETWQRQGSNLPEAEISVRGIGVSRDGRELILTTHRGLYRSGDGGTTWVQLQSNLPVHLEAGSLVRDPTESDTYYAGFSLTPFAEIWRRAEQGNSLLSQIDPVSLAGGAAFLALLAVGGVLIVRRLSRKAATVGAPTTKPL